MKNVGVGLVIAVYIALVFTSSFAPVAIADAGIVATRAHLRPDPIMMAVAVAGMAIAAIPLRRGERWAALTSVLTLTLVLTNRFSTGGRRLFPLDPYQHGNSSIIPWALTVLALAGLALTSYSAGGDRSRHGLK